MNDSLEEVRDTLERISSPLTSYDTGRSGMTLALMTIKAMAEDARSALSLLDQKASAQFDQSISHWGMFSLPKHEPEVVEARRRFENILYPVCHTILDVRV